jgi:hypothetical protein
MSAARLSEHLGGTFSFKTSGGALMLQGRAARPVEKKGRAAPDFVMPGIVVSGIFHVRHFVE